MERHALLFVRTLVLSAVIGVLCLLLGFPIAHLLVTLPLRYSNLLMIFVLLPFWTSLLVRTTSWMVLLQSQGMVNDFLVALGVVGDDGRIQMMYNQIGTVVAMTHILLPFMVLPLYSVMKTIPPSYVRAARSFGEVVVVLFVASFDQQTIPRQMWNGIREQISPTILAVATVLVFFSIALLAVIELLRRRSERLRGVTPG